jgi:hypothetical protein
MKLKQKASLQTTAIVLVLALSGILVQAKDFSISEKIQAAQAAGSTTNLLAVLKEIEAIWPTNAGAYFLCQNELNKALEYLYPKDAQARKIFELQSKLTLTKKCPDDVSLTGGCFAVKNDIVERIAAVTDSAPTLGMALLMATNLGELRSKIIPNYHALPVSINVAPPVLPTNGASKRMWMMHDGMDPNLIEDPVAKDAYLKVIAENNSNRAKNNFQAELSHLNKIMTSNFLEYVKKVSNYNPVSKKQANDLAVSAHLTEEEINLMR